MSNVFKESPKEMFTKDGYLDFLRHIGNMKEGMFFIMNHLDDLKPEDEFSDSLHDASIMINFLHDEYVKTSIK